ncbi:hypothetical protein [Levilactobacillus brevis]|uniref:hypothetical protein n=1 Tax=Levilactobacillus brevis TaxID=1580 RepID=UPI0021A602A0|nr:hypothetical protein [Levilactobacillus brevis]
MATPNVGILTTAGKALIDKVNSGQAKISFSKIVFSSMDNSQLSDMQVKDLTAIAPQEVVVSSPETTLDTNSGETRIRATGTNEKLADGVYVKTYGVFAKDDTGSEILYGVTVSPNPNYFPAYDGVTPQAVTYSYKTVIQETSNITMTNSNDVYASQEDLTEAIAAIPQPDLSNYATNRQLATKANDSKVVHKTGDEEISGSKTFDTAPIDKTTGNPYITKSDLNNGLSTKVNVTDTTNWQKNKVTSDDGSPFINLFGSNQDLSATLLSLGLGLHTVYANGSVQNNPLKGISSVKGVIDIQGTAYGEGFLIGTTNQGISMYHVWIDGSKANYTQMANDNTVVHSTDMRKPASDVAGIEEVSTKQDKIGYTPADDSKVAHLSGANNFDTVPTVNNNPLLLASSLPSDLARTSQQTNFPAGLQSGGVDVATAADLKSIEASAWRPLTLKNSTSGTILFKDNGDGTASLTGTAIFTIAKGMKKLIPAITPPTGYTFTSLKWNIDSWNEHGVWANNDMGGGSSGVVESFDTTISNGNLCFLGQDDDTKIITFSPSELTTISGATTGDPALVSISKV